MFGDYKENEIPEEIRSNIVYYYKSTNKDLLKLYNDSAIFVLPSLVEGMSLPPLEAMSCGCAVVVTDNGGTNEYIVDGFNGLVCPIKDSNCLSDKVVYLLNNKQKMLELIKNSAETARKYSYDEMINNFVSLMKEYIDT
jgi:glycosyltransferase involved in cell wall biosynthesis